MRQGLIKWDVFEKHGGASSRKAMEMLIGKAQQLLWAPDRDEKLRAAMQHFATKGDFPAETRDIIEKFHQLASYDMGYETIFDIRPFQNTTASGFDMLDVYSTLTFTEIPVGEKIRVKKFGGERSTVPFVDYGGALGWHRNLLADRQYWTMEDSLMEFQNKAYYARAAAFYALIDAVSSAQNLAWQAPTPAALANTDARYVMSRDVNTINKACETILLAVADKGYGVTANTPFVLLAPLQLKGRMTQALNWADLTQGGTKSLQYNVNMTVSMMLSSSTSYYVCLPRFKAKGGYRQDLTLEADRDILANIDYMAGWMRFGGAIGDEEQFQRCATS